MALITDSTFDSLRETLGLRKSSSYVQQGQKKNRDPNIFQNPDSFFPHADFDNALWVVIKARKIQNINTKGRGGSVSIAEHGPTWKFLAPDDLVEVHNHIWDEYESFHSRLLEKIRALHVGVDNWATIFDSVKKEFTTGVWTDITAKNFMNKLESSIKNVSNVNLPTYKIDTPLTYVSTGRRTYDINFTLASATGGSDMVYMVKLLQKYAAPDMKGDDELQIDFPWIFELTTEPSDLLKVNHAVITSIQPTWKQPYVNGNPIHCDLTVSFTDMSPLFKKTIEEGTIINVSETSGMSTNDAQYYKRDPYQDARLMSDAVRPIERGLTNE